MQISYKRQKVGRGRPGPSSEYRIEKEVSYSLEWEQDKARLARQRRVDRVVPCLVPIPQLAPRRC